jgi:hypothetical protein
MKKLFLTAALFLGAVSAWGTDVNVWTPEGLVIGHVGGSSTNLVTPYGVIIGDTGHASVIVELPSGSIVIPATPGFPGPCPKAPWDY